MLLAVLCFSIRVSSYADLELTSSRRLSNVQTAEKRPKIKPQGCLDLLQRYMLEAVLRSQNIGFLVFRVVDAGSASNVDVITMHAAVHYATTHDTRNIRDANDARTVPTFWTGGV